MGINLLIDINGNAGFDDWFDEDDAEKIQEALASIGKIVTIEEVDYEFKEYPILKKKERFSAIPLTSRNIFLILSNLDSDNDKILKILGIERESGFVITTLGRKLQGEYIKWQKIDHEKEWANEAERLRGFANFFESTKKISDKKIETAIKTMTRFGCKRESESKFPECGTQFNIECKKCMFGKSYIETDADIERFNIVLNRKGE